MNRQSMIHRSERGATALFLVIFSAVLLTVITVSFAGMMVNEQSRSLDNVLSQAAYDSATDGVEDAKRVIVACQNGSAAACNAIAASNCDTTVAAGVVPSADPDGSIPIQSSVSGTGSNLEQAYTCVKVAMNSPNFIVSAPADQSVMVPLNAVANVAKIGIDWYQNGIDGTKPVGGFPITGCYGASLTALCSSTAWPAGAPPILRTQFILPGSTINNLSDLDTATGQSLFLRPNGDFASPSGVAAPVIPRYTLSPTSGGGINTPVTASCSSVTTYACHVDITVSVTPGSSFDYLRLNTIYANATVRITLYDAGGNIVDFNGVQPTVDSTGRANDVYRRVLSRLSLSQLVFPLDNALDIGGNLCKDYGLTTSGVLGGSCTP